MSDFASRMIELCEKYGSDQDFVEKINASCGTSFQRNYMTDIRNGKRNNPSADTLIGISKAFGVSIDWLLGLSDTKETIGGDIDNAAATTGLTQDCIKALQMIGSVSYKNALELIIKQAASVYEDDLVIQQPYNHTLLIDGSLLQNLSKYFTALNDDLEYWKKREKDDDYYLTDNYVDEESPSQSEIDIPTLERLGLLKYSSPIAYIYATKIFEILIGYIKNNEFPILEQKNKNNRRKKK